MTSRIRRKLLLILATLSSPSYAGNGNITPPIDGEGESQANEISLSIDLTAPLPTESDGEDLLEMAKRQMEWANRIICDLTDDQFRISDVTFVQGEAAL
jgi:hypothetical protein